MAVELRIDSKAHLKGLEQTIARLKELNAGADTTNKTFRDTRSLDVFNNLIKQNYHQVGAAKGTLKGYTSSIGMYLKTVKQVTDLIKSGETLTFIDPQGVTRNVTSVSEAISILESSFKEIQSEADAFTAAMGKSFDSGSYDSYIKNLNRHGDAVEMFSGKLQATKFKLDKLKERGTFLALYGGKDNQEELKKIQEETAKLTAEYEKLEKQSGGTAVRIRNLVKNFVSAQLVVYALRLVVGSLVRSIRESAQAAAEAEQIFGRFDVVFESITKAARDMAESIGADTGYAASSIATAMSEIGDTFINLGASEQFALELSEQLTRGMADIMAYRNISGTLDETISSLMSGIMGNTANFRKFGVSIKAATVDAELHRRGLAGLTGEARELASAQARMDLFLQAQSKAVGAVSREWDTYLGVQRRSKEATREMKELSGTFILETLNPIAKWWTEIKERTVAAARAARDYAKGDYNPKDTITEGTRSAVERSLGFYFRSQGISRSSNPPATLDLLESVARERGVYYETVAEIAKTIDISVSDELLDTVRGIDDNTREAQNLKRLYDKQSSLKERQHQNWYDWLEYAESVIDPKFDDLFRTGSIDYEITKREPLKFRSFSLENVLGLAEDEQDLKNKSDALMKILEEVHNKILLAKADPDFGENTLFAMEEAYKAVSNEIVKINQNIEFSKAIKPFQDQKAELEKRAELSKQFAEDEQNLLSIYMDEWKSLNSINLLYEKGLITEAQKSEIQKLITENAQAQKDIEKDKVDLLREQTAEKNKQQLLAQAEQDRAKKMEAVTASMRTIDEAVFVGGGRYTQSQSEIARLSMGMREDLVKAGATMSFAIQQSIEYRVALERKAADEVYSEIVDSWKDFGDLGMIAEVIDSFKIMSMGLKDNDAALTSWLDVALRIASEFSIFDELFGFVGKFAEMMDPIVSNLLGPLLPVMEGILDVLIDAIMPALHILYPVIQGVSTVFVYMNAVIKTVTNTFSWMGRSLEVFVYNLTHWFNPKRYPNLQAETEEIWQKANEAVDKIWSTELDARRSFVSELTDIQKGELEAYNEMFKTGLLTLSQYEALVQKNIYGRSSDLRHIEWFGSGGDFVASRPRIIGVGERGPERITITPMGRQRASGNTYTYSVVVNGANADPQEIARMVRREFGIMERRGAAFA